jgi:hypothetical protein
MNYMIAKTMDKYFGTKFKIGDICKFMRHEIYLSYFLKNHFLLHKEELRLISFVDLHLDMCV